MKFLVLASIFLLPAQVVGDRAELRLSPKKNSSITYKVTSEVTQSIDIGGKKVDSTTDLERSYVFAYGNADADGTLNATLTFGPIKGTRKDGAGEAVHFDSTSAAAEGKAATLEAGIEVALKLSKQADIVEAKGLAGSLKARLTDLTKGDAKATEKVKPLAAKLTDDHSKKALVGLVPRLPKSAVAVGDQFVVEHGWHHCFDVVRCVEFDQKCKVIAIDSDTVTIEVTGDSPASESSIPAFSVGGVSMGGTLVFSRNDGLLKSMNIRENVATTESTAAGGVATATTVTVTRFERSGR